MTNADLARLINSDEIQSVLNPAKPQQKIYAAKANPLKSLAALEKLDAFALTRGAWHKKQRRLVSPRRLSSWPRSVPLVLPERLSRHKARHSLPKPRLRAMSAPKDSPFLKQIGVE